MRINVEEFKRAGKIANQVKFTDEELKLLITATQLSLAYLEGRGLGYGLVTTPLRRDLETFKSFAIARKLKGFRWGDN